jgi:hypothetical protein
MRRSVHQRQLPSVSVLRMRTTQPQLWLHNNHSCRANISTRAAAAVAPATRDRLCATSVVNFAQRNVVPPLGAKSGPALVIIARGTVPCYPRRGTQEAKISGAR